LPLYVVNQIIKMLILSKKNIEWSRILVLWLTFKENVPDFRNSKIGLVIWWLKEFWISIEWYDPYRANLHPHILNELHLEHGEVIDSLGKNYDGVIFSQNHKVFESIDIPSLLSEDGIIFDLKGKFRKMEYKNYKSL
jgi:UDP-N-acetyl-D-galactosamine dehydrogenase